MQFALGLESQTTTARPDVYDVEGYLARGLCVDELEHSVKVNDTTREWVHLTESEIVVQVPATPSEI